MNDAVELLRSSTHLEVGIVDGAPMLRYSIDPRYRPHIHPLYVPGTDLPLTRFRPVDHPWQYGVFVGLNHVDDFDFWCVGDAFYPVGTRGAIIHRHLEVHEGGGAEVSFSVTNDLLTPEGEPIAEDRQTYHVPAPGKDASSHYVVDLTWQLRATQKPLHIGRHDYGGFSFRLLGEVGTRHNFDSEGRVGDACHGPRARWSALAQPIDGMDGYDREAADPLAYAYAGVAMFDHPSNSGHPTRWWADGTGLVSADFQAADLEVSPDEPITYRYRLWVFRGAGDPDAAEAAYQEWVR